MQMIRAIARTAKGNDLVPWMRYPATEADLQDAIDGSSAAFAASSLTNKRIEFCLADWDEENEEFKNISVIKTWSI